MRIIKGILIFCIFSGSLHGATGDPFAGLTSAELNYFNAGKSRFTEIDTVSSGLGPIFNLNSCSGCHAQPAIGGTSPSTNPQIAVATLMGAKNSIPDFITLNGPVREARFINNANGTPDGSVHELFVITGRSDAGSCNIDQPNFQQQEKANNVIFRIPTPLFGLGLVENIEDSTIIANQGANSAQKQKLGIAGMTNNNGNTQTIAKFGWKAQNATMMLFSGEAYVVEIGVTNEIFATKRNETPGCIPNGLPEDITAFTATDPLVAMADIVGFTEFMRFMAPPVPLPLTPQAQQGQETFVSIGCSLCHTPMLTTAKSTIPQLSNQPANLYSDLLVHHMGQGLADGITQGLAGPDQFRTAPLWGISQRLFFLHDGRTNSLMTAILAHADQKKPPPYKIIKGDQGPGPTTPSEANAVIANFQTLNNQDQSNVIAFLQSL